MTALNVYHTHISFSDPTTKKFFPARYMLNLLTELALQYVLDYKICYN